MNACTSNKELVVQSEVSQIATPYIQKTIKVFKPLRSLKWHSI